MPASADSRALATWLAAQDDDVLRQIFTARGISPSAGWNDFFDAAEGLQDAGALGRALAGLSRPLAEALATAGDGPVSEPERTTLIARGLVGVDGIPFAPVSTAVATLGPLPPAVTPADAAPRTDDAAAERAFTSAAALADILQIALTAPLGRIGNGALGAADRRRLVDSGAAHDTAEADDLVALAAATGLAAIAAGSRPLHTAARVSNAATPGRPTGS